MPIVFAAGHRIDTTRRSLADEAGRPVELRPQALELLCVLAEHAGEVVGKQTLFERVWPGMVITDDSLVQAVGDARRALGDEARQCLQTVPRRGYRLVADAGPAASPASAGSPAQEPAQPLPSSSTRRPLRWVLAGAVLAGLIALSTSAWPPGHHAPRAKPELAVLPFRAEPEDSGDALLAQGLAADLIGELARDAALPVVAGQSSFQPELRHLAVPEAAKRLNVRYLVDGSVRRDGDRLQVRVELIDGQNGRIAWTHEAGLRAGELPTLRDTLVRRLAGSLDASMRQAEIRRALSRAPASWDAYTLAVRAFARKHRFTPADHAAARADAENAVKLDPEFAFAWAVLSLVNSLDAQFRITGQWADPRPRLQEALTQAERALAIDPALPLAYLARADALIGLGDASAAVAAAEAGVRLAPGDGEILNELAGAQVLAGRVDEATATMERVRPLFPIPPLYVRFASAFTRWAANDLAGAIDDLNDCLRRAPRHLGCLGLRASVRVEQGRLEDARADVQRFLALAPRATRVHLLEPLKGAPALAERRRLALEAIQFPPP